MKMRNI